MIGDRFPRYLVLLLTEACNLHCAYCYRGDPSGMQYMPRDIAEAGIRLAASSGLPFHVQMTGGEPTLEPGLIERVAGLIRKEAWPATIGIQTNGTLLDRSIIRIFKKYDIQVGVSLDGPPSIQETLRGKAYATMKGLKLLSDEGVGFRVTAVITDKNVMTLEKLALLLSFFPSARGLGLDLLVRKGRALKDNCASHPSPQELRDGLKMLMQALSWVNENRSQPIELRELTLLKLSAERGNLFAFCHACKGESMAVHPDGTVYPCSQTVGDPDFALGTIDALDRTRIPRLGDYRLEGEDCKTCALSGFCPGDCPSRLYYNGIQKGRLACVMYQTLWKEYTRRLK